MDEQLIAQKLESLRCCIQRAESRLPKDLETLQADIDVQDIIALNLTRAIQMCVDIASHWLAEHADATAPKTMGQTFEALADSGSLNANSPPGCVNLWVSETSSYTTTMR